MACEWCFVLTLSVWMHFEAAVQSVFHNTDILGRSHKKSERAERDEPPPPPKKKFSKDESNLTAISSLALPPVSRMIVSSGLSARSHPLPTGHGRFALRLLTWTVGTSESRLISCCLHLTLCRENNVVKPPEIGNLQQRWKWKARYSSAECFL